MRMTSSKLSGVRVRTASAAEAPMRARLRKRLVNLVIVLLMISDVEV